MGGHWSWSRFVAVFRESLTGRRRPSPSPTAPVALPPPLPDPVTVEAAPLPESEAKPEPVRPPQPEVIEAPVQPEPIREDVAAIIEEYARAGVRIDRHRASWIAHDRDMAAKRAAHLLPIIEGHAATLWEQYDQLVKKDRYGTFDFAPWNRERDYFIRRVAIPRMERYVKKDSDDWFAIVAIVEGVVDRYGLNRIEAEIDGMIAEADREEAADLPKRTRRRKAAPPAEPTPELASPPARRSRRKPPSGGAPPA